VTDEGSIAGQTVDAFLKELASDSATPGGGPVAALEGAMGSALISMVCNLTIDKTGYEEAQERVRGILVEAEQARTAFLELADRDAHAFDGVMEAFKMPKETDAEKAVRAQAIQEGYEGAATVPLEIAKRAAELMELAREVTEIGNAAAASDGACAAQALSSCVWSATYNVEINAAALKDPAKARALRDEVSALRAHAEALLDATNVAFGARLG
jgi:methenyltetrahydrofolate cyclohydrolase